MFDQQAVEILEEVVAVVGIVLPGIFTVENDADHRRLAFRGGIEDGFKLQDEMLGGVAAVPFGIVEADQVREPLIAEEQRQSGSLLHLPGMVGGMRIRNAAGDEAVFQHAFAAGNPATAGRGQVFYEILGDGAFGGPHADRRRAETSGVAASRGVDVGDDATASSRVGRGEGQRGVGQAFTRDAEVEQQRRQRMRLRRR